MNKSVVEISKIVKANFLLLIGVAVFTYNLFNFTHLRWDRPVSYYYNKHTLILLAIGVIFITIGLLKLKNKKEGES